LPNVNIRGLEIVEIRLRLI